MVNRCSTGRRHGRSLLVLQLNRRAIQQGRGLFTVLMCADCQAARGHGAGPYPVMTRAQMRAGLDLLPTWALEQKAAANRQVIAFMRRRLAAGEDLKQYRFLVPASTLAMARPCTPKLIKINTAKTMARTGGAGLHRSARHSCMLSRRRVHPPLAATSLG
jgi:hypothetical protein